MQLRLDKYLADAGFGTRTEVKALIRSKRVQVDGTPAKPDQKVDPEVNRVTVDGKPAGYSEYEYYILNKPAGVLSASRDKKEKTVIDLIPEPKRRDLFPVGRLDRDTVGLLLITNDGQLSHRLLSPGKHVSKVYRALIQGELPEDAAEQAERGLDIGDEEPTAPAKLIVVGEVTPERVKELAGRYNLDYEALLQATACHSEGSPVCHSEHTRQAHLCAQPVSEESRRPCLTNPRDSSVASLPQNDRESNDSTSNNRESNDSTSNNRESNGSKTNTPTLTEVTLTLTEGRFHEVKRIFAALGCEVMFLQRLSMGTLTLPPELGPGESMPLTGKQLDFIR